MYFLDITRILGAAGYILRVYYKYIIYKYSYKYNCTLVIDGEPWFVGKDVAEALKYNEPHKAIQRHISEDDGMKRPITDSTGRSQNTWVINESGLYALIFGSKLESAKRFKRWVTAEVLPAIRKTGGYVRNLYDMVYSEAIVLCICYILLYICHSYIRTIYYDIIF